MFDKQSDNDSEFQNDSQTTIIMFLEEKIRALEVELSHLRLLVDKELVMKNELQVQFNKLKKQYNELYQINLIIKAGPTNFQRVLGLVRTPVSSKRNASKTIEQSPLNNPYVLNPETRLYSHSGQSKNGFTLKPKCKKFIPGVPPERAFQPTGIFKNKGPITRY